MNERITSKKKPQKLQIVQHFFGLQLAGAAPVLLLRATGVSSTSHLVDGLPHACHTETVAQPGILGPAQNGEPPP